MRLQIILYKIWKIKKDNKMIKQCNIIKMVGRIKVIKKYFFKECININIICRIRGIIFNVMFNKFETFFFGLLKIIKQLKRM